MSFSKNVYQLQETTLDKLEFFNIGYSANQKLFMNVAICDLESIYVEEDKFLDTDTTTWIGEHVPVSVWIWSNLIEQPIFLCNSSPWDLVESSVDALDGFETQGKVQIK